MDDIRNHWAHEWASMNPILRNGEPGYDKTSGRLKVGNGHTRWTELNFLSSDARLSDESLHAIYMLQTNPALRTFRAAIANRQSKGAAIWTVGDSITEGQGVNNASLSWPNLLAQGLRTRYPVSWATGGPGFVPPFRTADSLPDPAVLTGSPAQVGYFGPASRCVVLTGTQTATYSVYGTSVDVAAAHGAGVLSVRVDGGAAQTFDLTGANEDGHFYRVPFGGRGLHTVTVGTASAEVYHTGIMVYDQDEAAGFHVFNGGRSGYSSRDWFNALGGTTITNLARGIQPTLVVYSLGANDFLHSEGSASLVTNTGLILDAIRAGCAVPPSILIHIMYPTAFTGIAPESWDKFVAALRTYADGHADCSVLDETVRMPAVAGDVLGLYTDAYHPSAAGHQMIADAIAGFVAAR